MSNRGAEFSDAQPRRGDGQIGAVLQLGGSSYGNAPLQGSNTLDTAIVQPITALNTFRLGQQILFYLGVTPGALPNPEDPYISRVVLKPWWGRPNAEYRMPGAGGWLPIDRANFGDGPNMLSELDGNRYVWIPSIKRLDTTEYDTAPIPTAPPRSSYSIFEDDLWVIDLPDYRQAPYPLLFGLQQPPSRWVAFLHPAMGFALGVTWRVELSNGQAPVSFPNVTLRLGWHTGTLGGGVYQESLG